VIDLWPKKKSRAVQIGRSRADSAMPDSTYRPSSLFRRPSGRTASITVRTSTTCRRRRCRCLRRRRRRRFRRLWFCHCRGGRYSLRTVRRSSGRRGSDTPKTVTLSSERSGRCATHITSVRSREVVESSKLIKDRLRLGNPEVLNHSIQLTIQSIGLL
jgi:hypothetical protein